MVSPSPGPDLTHPLHRHAEQMRRIVNTLAAALGAAGTDPRWLQRTLDALLTAQDFAARQPDAMLFLLFQHAAHSTEQYSVHHALLCAALCERVATESGWPAHELAALTRAATTMNVAMIQLQDQLTQQSHALRPEQRARIERHAEHGAQMLSDTGVADPLWIEVVRLHHDPMLAERPSTGLTPARRLARLLRLVDRFTAQVSRRGHRLPLAPMIAARNACVGPDGREDEFGVVLLRSLGMYPPGSYVKLASGELGVVLRHDASCSLPRVAVISTADGQPLAEPVLCTTARHSRSVVTSVAVSEVRQQPAAAQILALL